MTGERWWGKGAIKGAIKVFLREWWYHYQKFEGQMSNLFQGSRKNLVFDISKFKCPAAIGDVVQKLRGQVRVTQSSDPCLRLPLVTTRERISALGFSYGQNSEMSWSPRKGAGWEERDGVHCYWEMGEVELKKGPYDLGLRRELWLIFKGCHSSMEICGWVGKRP